MFRCMSPGAIGIRIPWPDCLSLARDNGFEGIDVPIDLQTPAAEYSDALEAHGLMPGGMGLPVDFRDDRGRFEEHVVELDALASRARSIGLRRFYTWVSPASDERTFGENWKFHVERLGTVARVLGRHDCLLGLEFIGPRSMREGHRYSFVRTMERMLDLCRDVGDNAGLLLDSWHWFTSLGTVSEILSIQAEDVVYVHVNDAPLGVPVERQLDSVRCIPGETGVENLPGFLDALRRIGYDGPVVPEPLGAGLEKLAPEVAAGRVGEAFTKVWDLPGTGRLSHTMNAIVTGSRTARIVDVPVPGPRGNEVIVKLHASPICGSNLPGFLGDSEHMNGGHEGAGEVVDVAQSNLLRVGDRVALAPLNACGRCRHCRAGDTIFCENRPEVFGTFAQYTRVADVACTVLPDEVDFEIGSLLGCCLGPPREALKRLDVRADDTVVVSGLGPVGLGATALATFLGARVVALEPEAYRRERAGEIGAHHVLDPSRSDTRETILALTDGVGVSKAIECSGRPDGQRLLFDLAGVRAAIAFVGENQGSIEVSPSRDFIRKGLTVIGCWHMNVNDASLPLQFLKRQPEKARLLISHRFGFSEAQTAFEIFASRCSAKVLLLPWA